MTVHSLAEPARRHLVQAIAAYMVLCNADHAQALATARKRYERFANVDLGAGAHEWGPLIAEAAALLNARCAS